MKNKKDNSGRQMGIFLLLRIIGIMLLTRNDVAVNAFIMRLKYGNQFDSYEIKQFPASSPSKQIQIPKQ